MSSFLVGGYGGNNKDGYKPTAACRNHGLPGEKKVCGHCAEAPNGVAMCSQFNGDNDGPDGSGSAVETSLSLARAAFPNATVFASTFDAFIREVLPVKDQLPTVTQEIGDTWIFGVASDPLKMAQHREIQRQWIACMKAGEASCQQEDKTIERMALFLHKAPDHTWGASSAGGDFNLGFPASQKLGHNGVRDYTKLNASRLLFPPFVHNAGTFAAQRYYNELAVMALEAGNHILAKPVRAAITRMTQVARPSVAGMTKLSDLGADVRLDAATVAVGANGALTTLRSKGGVQWATPSRATAQLVYRVYNDTDYDDFGGWYGPRGYWPFCKANDNVTYMLGIDSNSNSQSAYFLPRVTAVYADVKASRLVVELSMPPQAVDHYGSFRTAFLDFRVSDHGGGSSNVGGDDSMDELQIDLSLTWLGKQPVMIGESISLLFAPAPTLSPGRSGANSSAWTMNKLGSEIDPENVVQGGNQHNHAVWRGVAASTIAGDYDLQILDAPLVNPMTDRPAPPDPSCAGEGPHNPHFPDPPGEKQKLCYGNASYPYGHAFPAGSAGLCTLAKDSVFGMASNIFNNLWGTNYPQFYPFPDTRYCAAGPLRCKNADAEFRYVLKLGGKTLKTDDATSLPGPPPLPGPKLPGTIPADVMFWYNLGATESSRNLTAEANTNFSRSQFGKHAGAPGSPTVSFSPFQIAYVVSTALNASPLVHLTTPPPWSSQNTSESFESLAPLQSIGALIVPITIAGRTNGYRSCDPNTNSSCRADLARFLTSSERRTAAVSELVAIAKKRGFRGWNFDQENLMPSTSVHTSPALTAGWRHFLRELAAAMAAAVPGSTVSVDICGCGGPIPLRPVSTFPDYMGMLPQDWKGLGVEAVSMCTYTNDSSRPYIQKGHQYDVLDERLTCLAHSYKNNAVAVRVGLFQGMGGVWNPSLGELRRQLSRVHAANLSKVALFNVPSLYSNVEWLDEIYSWAAQRKKEAGHV